MNILHINTYENSGGAGKAASRIHQSLVRHGEAIGISSRLRAIYGNGADPEAIVGPPGKAKDLLRGIKKRIAASLMKASAGEPHSFTTLGWPSTGLGAELETLRRRGLADICHLHWIADGTISTKEIGRIRQPVVWTLHDQWAFCGTEHYTACPEGKGSSSELERYEEGYTATNRPKGSHGLDIARLAWQQKTTHWRRPFHIVTPSHWLADCVSRSALMANWPVRVIPNTIDTDAWRPLDQAVCRRLLQLPIDRTLLLFGGWGGSADRRKGGDILQRALRLIADDPTCKDRLALVVFGQSEPDELSRLGLETHYLGRLWDEASMKAAYNAADAIVIPSRQDNLPNTGVEAQACGLPVIAFNIGGLPDIVDHHRTGALAEAFDPGALASAILWTLDNPSRRQELSSRARNRAVALWHPQRIASQYAEIYREASEGQRPVPLRSFHQP